MAGQVSPLAFSPTISNTCSRRFTWPSVSFRWSSKASRSLAESHFFDILGSAFSTCFSA